MEGTYLVTYLGTSLIKKGYINFNAIQRYVDRYLSNLEVPR